VEYGLLITIHVVCGALWACIAWFFGQLLMPAVGEAGPGGGAVMGALMKRKMPVYLTAFSTLSVLAGLSLYMLRFGGVAEWSAERIVLTVASVLGLYAYGKGFLVSKPLAEKIGALAAKLSQAPGAPDPALLAELQAAQAKMAKLGKSTAHLLMTVFVLMAAHHLAANL
jgi:hypothetical protein